VSHPRFGELIPCDCTLRRRAERQAAQLAALSNLAAFRAQTFATFDPDVPGVRRAYVRACAFAQRPQGWLLLFGPCGVGKTHLAAATAHAALTCGTGALLAVVPDLLDHLRAAFAPESPIDYDELVVPVRSVPLLILDDLGTARATPWTREKLYQIISHRAVASAAHGQHQQPRARGPGATAALTHGPARLSERGAPDCRSGLPLARGRACLVDRPYLLAAARTISRYRWPTRSVMLTDDQTPCTRAQPHARAGHADHGCAPPGRPAHTRGLGRTRVVLCARDFDGPAGPAAERAQGAPSQPCLCAR